MTKEQYIWIMYMCFNELKKKSPKYGTGTVCPRIYDTTNLTFD